MNVTTALTVQNNCTCLSCRGMTPSFSFCDCSNRFPDHFQVFPLYPRYVQFLDNCYQYISNGTYTSIEGLIGEDEKPAKRGPSPKLQRHLERISALPKPKQRAVMEVLEAVLAQSSR